MKSNIPYKTNGNYGVLHCESTNSTPWLLMFCDNQLSRYLGGYKSPLYCPLLESMSGVVVHQAACFQFHGSSPSHQIPWFSSHPLWNHVYTPVVASGKPPVRCCGVKSCVHGKNTYRVSSKKDHRISAGCCCWLVTGDGHRIGRHAMTSSRRRKWIVFRGAGRMDCRVWHPPVKDCVRVCRGVSMAVAEGYDYGQKLPSGLWTLPLSFTVVIEPSKVSLCCPVGQQLLGCGVFLAAALHVYYSDACLELEMRLRQWTE